MKEITQLQNDLREQRKEMRNLNSEMDKIKVRVIFIYAFYFCGYFYSSKELSISGV